MPIYEYRCAACGHELEALQKISDPPLVDCPVCGKAELRKRVTAAAFRLKGTGWYETDFKNSAKNKKAKPSATAEKKSSGSSSGGGAKSDSSSSSSGTTGGD